MAKKHILSKILSLLMVLSLVLGLLPVIGSAAPAYTTDGAYIFKYSDSGIEVVQKGEGGEYKISGTTLKIQAEGTYIVSGSCAEGFLQVSKGVTGVTLVLNGLTLTNATTCPVSINKSTGVTLVVADGTVNTLTDNAYNNDTVYTANGDAENAVIKCKDGSQVTICGGGTLNLIAKGERGLKSGGTDIETDPANPREAWLVIKEATINVTATAGNGANGGDAIKADSLLKVLSGNLNLAFVDDGLKSDGDVYIGEAGTAGPTINMTQGCEGIEGVNVYCYSGDVTINVNTNASGGGGNGIKADNVLKMVKGKYTISCNDDAIKCEYYVYIGAPCSTEGPTIDVKKSYEGIEGANIFIYGGDIKIEASDDAMNAANSDLGGSQPGGPGGRPGSGSSSSYAFDLQILGGKIYCNSDGDGLDSNKALTVRGGETVVLSSKQQDNSALDADGVVTITGGVFLGVSYKGMFSSISNSQYYLTASNQSIRSGQNIWVTDINGNTFNASTTTATRSANFIFFSSPELANSPSENYVHYGTTSYNSGRQGQGKSDPYVVTDHELVTAPAVPATCSSTGLTEGSYCADCGTVYSVQQVTPMLEHNPVEVAEVPATCTEKGSTAGVKCSHCGLIYSGCEKIKKLGHDLLVQNKVAGTCTSEGYTGDEYCQRCNTVVTAGTVIPAPGHNVVNDPAVDATCTADGKTAGSVCSTCGEVFSASTVIPATGHATVVLPAKEATCTTTGLTEGSYCSTCGEVLVAQTVVAPKGHTPEIVPGTPATCLSSGLTDGQICADCGVVLVQQTTIQRLGHSFSYTDNGNGNHSGACIRCGKTQAAASHSYDADGVCTACGEGSKPAPTLDASVKIYHSLNLASDISINYVVFASQLSAYDSCYMECVLPVYSGNTLTGTRTIRMEPEAKGAYYYFTLTGVNAVQMGDMIEATVYMSKDSADYMSNTDSYSVADYAYAQLEKAEAADALKSLCADLLRYGAAAQTYKEYRTDALVDAEMTLDQLFYLSDLGSVGFGNNNTILDDLADPQITWVGKTLSLDSKVTLKFVFSTASYTGSVEDLSLRVTFTNYAGEECQVILTGAEAYGSSGNRYSFDFDGLLAAELRKVVNVAVYAGDTQLSQTMSYSADTYGIGKTGTLGELCKALMAYSDSALAYFA
ncbi:MAG: carbohydrate-binding domain-containing protein [Oscillospiraceae bacterium]|nr:carbohydrate-binding domain-containing protein [Oscillospiraceae bacterium]